MSRGGTTSPGDIGDPGPWLLRFTPRPQAGVRLFCFSSAGSGGAMYRPWLDTLPSQFELCAVQLPGRENRLREKPFNVLSSLVETLLPALRPHMDRPFAFFGHSMGAMVAYELTRALRATGGPLPSHLMVSGRRAPHLPETDTPLHRLDDGALIAEIGRRYGGVPAEVLQHRDLMELLLPGLRADMTAVETHVHVPDAALQCPITSFGGASDARATPAQLSAWSTHTSQAHRTRLLPGGHFYFQDAAVRTALVGEIAEILRSMPAPVAEPSAG